MPPQPIQELRDLTRTRKQLTREIVQHTQRIQAVLEEANIKLSSVITELLGSSGRRILKAIVAGESDPQKLAELGSQRLAASPSQLTDALHGRIREHHCFLIDQHLKTIEQLEATIAAFDARIEAALEPFRYTIERLKAIPGLSETSIQVLLAEIGTDMSQFPTAGHLLSWAGLVPRLDESAGKRRSTRVRKGAPWLKNDARAVCLGSGAGKEQLLPGPVPATQEPRGPEEGGGRRRRLDPDHRLSHAAQTEPSIRTWAPHTSPAATRPAPPSASPTTSAASASKSKSAPQHDTTTQSPVSR